MRRTTDKIDDLARRAFAGEPGANASFANRLRLRIAGERAAIRQRNTRIVVGSIITAVAASVVLLLVFTVDWSKPAINSTARANTPVREVPAPKDGKQGEHALPRPEVKPEPRPPANTPENPREETPKDGAPEEPKPEPKPEEKPQPKPEEKPQPRPEEKPQPKPEQTPAKPDEVEKPKEEPKTEVQPKERRELGSVVAFEKAARAKIRYADSETWRDLAQGEKLLVGAQLEASAPVDFTIGAATLRFDGEITLEENSIELRKDSLYADNLALKQAIVVTAGELRAELNGVAVFDISSSGLRIDVLHGHVNTASGETGANLSAVLSKRGLSKPRVFARSTVAKLLKGVPARTFLREDFEKEPAGGLYGGHLKSGIAISQGGNDSIAFKFEPRHALLPGEVIRVHFRVSKAKTLLIQMFDEAKNDNFGYEISSWKSGEWQTLEFKPGAMLDRESGKVRPQAGTEFVNFQFRIEGPQEALLEIDWIEIVRIEE